MLDVRTRVTNELDPVDIAGYVRLRSLSRLVYPQAGLYGVDYWKSAPYFLTFCGGYRLEQRIKECTDPALAAALQSTPHITRTQMKDLKPIVLGNARLRALAADYIDTGMWRLLWMPPSLPYLRPGGPYAGLDLPETTKRLVFSSWTATPASVASLLSHEVRRQVYGTGKRAPSVEAGDLLKFTGIAENGRPKYMTSLMLF